MLYNVEDYGSMDCVYGPEHLTLDNITFRKPGLCLTSADSKEATTLLRLSETGRISHRRLALSKEPNRAYGSLPSPEDGNRCSF
jgi:hypothetical protein